MKHKRTKKTKVRKINMRGICEEDTEKEKTGSKEGAVEVCKLRYGEKSL